VGITSSGNGVGLTREELDALDPTDRAERLARAAAELTAAGADFIIEDVSQLMGVVEEIARRLVA
jgi:phosphonoacetaldehyde hydrolase